MTFPRFKLNMSEDNTPPEVLERRARFMAGPLSKRILARDVATFLEGPEEAAEAFGRDMFARCGKDWPRMIGLASGAAMKAEREATGEV